MNYISGYLKRMAEKRAADLHNIAVDEAVLFYQVQEYKGELMAVQ